jgi:hypothetical protein
MFEGGRDLPAQLQVLRQLEGMGWIELEAWPPSSGPGHNFVRAAARITESGRRALDVVANPPPQGGAETA